jgi:hypothetical protein
MHDDVILLLEHQPQVSSTCRHALGMLGYTRILYRDYRRSGSVVPIGQSVDAVVAAWTDRAIDRDAFLAAVEGATDLPNARGALVVSPFSTPANAAKLRLRGAKAWVRFPFAMTQFDSRLRFLLEGDRRRRDEPVPFDRRHEPVFPAAMPV